MEPTLSEEEFSQKLQEQSMIGQDFIEAALRYWLEDNEDFSCPFPEYMHAELSQLAVRLFLEWTFELDKAEPISDDELSEKFNEIISDAGLSLARTEDEQLTIEYPYLPRVGDKLNFHDSASGIRSGEILERSLAENAYGVEVRVLVRDLDTNENWETGFPLQA